MGDSQASLFAQHCFEPGQAKATLGTGTSLLVNLGGAYRPPTHGAVVALAWSHNGQSTYAAEGIISYSAATLSWLRDQLGLIQKDDGIEALAASVPDCGGVHLIPAFAGLSAPHWRPDARGAIVGLSAHTRKAHVVRAALESIAFQIHDALQMIAAEFGVTPQVLRVDGGPTRNQLLMQLLADLTGVPLEIGASPESSALGVAMACRIGCGEATLESLATAPRERRRIEPKISSAERDRRHREWKTALQRVL
jgi:glycerol kinase